MAKTRNRTQSKRPHAAIAAQRSNHPLLYVGSLVVLVIITVTFIGTPAIGRFGGAGAGTVFGTYNGIAIEHRRGNYFDSQILQISQQRRSSGFRQDTETEARAVVRQAFQRAAYRVAVLAETGTAPLAVSTERIDGELIRSGPYVIGGVFSEERYNATPASQRKVNRRLVEEQLLETPVLLRPHRRAHQFASGRLLPRHGDRGAPIPHRRVQLCRVAAGRAANSSGQTTPHCSGASC